MTDFITNILLSNVWYFLLFFVGLLLLAHLLVFPRNLSKKSWKKVDFIWLGIAAIGLITLTGEVRVTIAKRWIEYDRYPAVWRFEELKSKFAYADNSYYCMELIRTEYSPDNFDELVIQIRARCSWVKEVHKTLSLFDADTLPLIGMDMFPEVTFTDPYLLETVNNIKIAVSDYSDFRESTLNTIAMTESSELEETVFYWSPFLLAIALALRIAKVSGELRYEKPNKG
jgi:hypothetical protein